MQAVYRIDPDGKIHRIITDAGKPNGVCVSPDQKTLYVVSNDNGTTGIGRLPKDAPLSKGMMALLAYDLAPDGSAKFRKTLVDYAPQDGPDGLVCDKEGNLYVAVRDETRPGIYVYSPDGKELVKSRPRCRPMSASAAARKPDALHHGGEKPLSHSGEQGRISIACAKNDLALNRAVLFLGGRCSGL